MLPNSFIKEKERDILKKETELDLELPASKNFKNVKRRSLQKTWNSTEIIEKDSHSSNLEIKYLEVIHAGHQEINKCLQKADEFIFLIGLHEGYQ